MHIIGKINKALADASKCNASTYIHLHSTCTARSRGGKIGDISSPFSISLFFAKARDKTRNSIAKPRNRESRERKRQTSGDFRSFARTEGSLAETYGEWVAMRALLNCCVLPDEDVEQPSTSKMSKSAKIVAFLLLT